MIAAYIRVSTTSQNEISQKREISRWLDSHGLPEPKWFVDKASGDNLDRPGFEGLQRAVFDGEVKTVVVYKLDRLSRSMKDGITVLTDWLGSGVRFVSVTQGFDLAGPAGKMIAAVLLGVAEMEQETRRERQRAGIEAAKARGVYKGRKLRTTKGKPQRAQTLRRRGLTIAEIASAMGVSTRTVDRYLA